MHRMAGIKDGASDFKDPLKATLKATLVTCTSVCQHIHFIFVMKDLICSEVMSVRTYKVFFLMLYWLDFAS